jgi:mannose-6-phosphate isomerase-like protein (cupin superfamily)
MSVGTPARSQLGRPSSEQPVARGLRVERWDVRRDGAVNERALQEKIAALGYDLLPLFDPHGAIVSARIHPLDRAVAVLAGLLKVSVDGEWTILTAGDIGFIPAGCLRRVEPVGASPLLCVEAVCRPPRF